MGLFQFENYQPNTQGIAALMLRASEAKAQALRETAAAQARAQEQRGQIYANLGANLGGLGQRAVENIAAERQAAPIRAMQAQLGQAQLDEAKLNITKNTDAIAAEKQRTAGLAGYTSELGSIIKPDWTVDHQAGMMLAAKYKLPDIAQSHMTAAGAEAAEQNKPITAAEGATVTTPARVKQGLPPLISGEPKQKNEWDTFLDSYLPSIGKTKPNQMTLAEANTALKTFNESKQSPAQPTVVPTASGPQILDKNTGTSKPILGPDGQPVKAPVPASLVVNPTALSDVKESVAGMKDGTLPPMLPGRATKEYLATMAEAHRQGYDLQAAATDWNATQKHIATLNGAQQTRLNQSINALPELLDSVDALAAKWKGGRFPILNKANLALAKNGVYGPEVASVANQLDSQIADVTADLGNVYMGGNSPTDHALELAGKSLKAEWDQKVLRDMVTLARKNVTIRQNSIKNTGVQGASANNPYVPAQPQTPTPKTTTGGLSYQDYLNSKGQK